MILKNIKIKKACIIKHESGPHRPAHFRMEQIGLNKPIVILFFIKPIVILKNREVYNC